MYNYSIECWVLYIFVSYSCEYLPLFHKLEKSRESVVIDQNFGIILNRIDPQKCMVVEPNDKRKLKFLELSRDHQTQAKFGIIKLFWR